MADLRRIRNMLMIRQRHSTLTQTHIALARKRNRNEKRKEENQTQPDDTLGSRLVVKTHEKAQKKICEMK